MVGKVVCVTTIDDEDSLDHTKYPELHMENPRQSIIYNIEDLPKLKLEENISISKFDKYFVIPCLRTEDSADVRGYSSAALKTGIVIWWMIMFYVFVLSLPFIRANYPAAIYCLICVSIFCSLDLLLYFIIRFYKLGRFIPAISIYGIVILISILQVANSYNNELYSYILSMGLIAANVGMSYKNIIAIGAIYTILVVYSTLVREFNFPTIGNRLSKPHPGIQMMNDISSGMGIIPGLVASMITVKKMEKEKARLLSVVNEVEKNAVKASHLELDEIEFTEIIPKELVRSFQKLSAGLSAFSKFVPVTLVKRMLKDSTSPLLGMREQHVTVWFMDIENFTGLSESLEPAVLISVTQELLEVASNNILNTGGTIDKYVGDAIMAFWGAPDKINKQGTRSCTAAINLLKAMNEELYPYWSSKGWPLLNIRIGINDGSALVGNFGCSQRMEYTCIGDVVNVASRLEGANKFYKSKILVSKSIYEECCNDFLLRPLGSLQVKGKQSVTKIYELKGMKNGYGDTPEIRDICNNYLDAMKYLDTEKYREAKECFQKHIQSSPNDNHTKLMLSKLSSSTTNFDSKDFYVILDVK